MTLGLVMVVAAFIGLCLFNLEPARFGAHHDDGIYVVTAKALATGQGYRIISLPDRPAQTKYPPLYPFLLSLIWRVYPDFPGNLRPMLLLSAMTATLFLLATYFYLTRQGHCGPVVALLIVGLMACNRRMILFSGLLYSELTYALLSLLAVWAAERCADGRRTWTGFLAGGLAGLACLTRTMGITRPAALALYLLARRSYRPLAAVLLGAALFIGPWHAWRRAQPPPKPTASATYYTDYGADFRDIVWEMRACFGTWRPKTFITLPCYSRPPWCYP